jgi:ATP-dependent DNA helicase PIF1
LLIIENTSRDYYRELTEEKKIGFEEEDLKIIDALNVEQALVLMKYLIK